MEKLPSRREFISEFKLPFSGFGNPVEFTDDTFGFSVVREHPNGYTSIFKVFILKDALKADDPILPIIITGSYGKKSGDSIILSSSSEKISKLFDPIELRSDGDFFYCVSDKTFLLERFLFKKRKIDAQEILQKIYELHIKPTRPFRGLWLRIKLFLWRVAIIGFLKLVSALFVKILFISSGIKVSPDIWNRIVFRDRLEEKKTDSRATFSENKTMDFYGYKASPWAIIFYCSMHLVAYLSLSYFGIRPLIFITIFKNSFLTIVYIVTTLTLLDHGMPWLLKYLIGRTDNLFYRTSSKIIKI